MNAPCKGCPDRYPACHDHCPKYQEYHAQCEERRRQKQLDGEIMGAKRKQIARMQRSKQRLMRMK